MLLTVPMEIIYPKILYFGTPVLLVSSLNENGTTNIAPMSSAWALGWTVMLGLGTYGKTFDNLSRERKCILNFPAEDLWITVEKLAPLTGKDPVPEYKQGKFRFEKDKFHAAGLTPVPSESVRPLRIAECPLQMEGLVQKTYLIGHQESHLASIEPEITRVYANRELLISPNYIDPARWHPLIYGVRHYSD